MRAGSRFWWPSSLPISTSVPIAAWTTSMRASAMFFLRIGERTPLVTVPIWARPDMHAVAVAHRLVAVDLEADQPVARMLLALERAPPCR